jgi:hypothetical protein
MTADSSVAWQSGKNYIPGGPMRRLPLITTAGHAANRVLSKLSHANGPLRAIATQAVSTITNFRETIDSRQWPARPEAINVEVTSICDARCIHCPRQDMTRSQKPMDLSLFKKLVDQAAEMRVPTLAPNGFGEVLTMRNLDEYLAYIRSTEHRFRIVLNTNGFRMDAEKREIFLKHEVDLINITLDGATAETFEGIRPRLKLATIEENIHELLRMRSARGLAVPKLRVGIIAIPQNEHEIQAVLEKWNGVVDYVGVGGFTNRAGSMNMTSSAAIVPSSPEAVVPSACVLPFKELNIWADGKAVLCCDDWNEEHSVGDLATSTLREIWQGTGLAHARKMHMTGRGGELNICGKCNMWRAPTSGARLWA